MSNFTELQKRAVEIRKKYDISNALRGDAQWGPQQLAMGFVGDVGELMQLVMAKEGLREIEKVDEKLKHELADCLWSILVLAKEYEINLEGAFIDAMNDIEARFKREDK